MSEACLAEKSAEACVNELIDSLLAGQSKDKAAASGPNATLLAAVIVPIVVVGENNTVIGHERGSLSAAQAAVDTHLVSVCMCFLIHGLIYLRARLQVG